MNMTDILMRLADNIKSVPKIFILGNLIKKYKIRRHRSRFYKKFVDKPTYTAFDIIDFVQLLRYSELLGYYFKPELDDDKLSYTYSTNEKTVAVTSTNSASLSYSTDRGSKKLRIICKASVSNALDTEGNISIELYSIDTTNKQEDYKQISSDEVCYTLEFKQLGDGFASTDRTKTLLNMYICDFLHDIFLISIERIFYGIERKYIS